jgi:hypothetical protein
LIAWLLAVGFLKNVNDRRLVVIAGVALDIDGALSLVSVQSFLDYHHTFGHSFVFGLPLALIAGSLAKDKLRVIPVALGTFSLHLVADIIGTNWAVYPLYPFSEFGLTIGSLLSNYVIYFVIDPVAFIIILIAVIVVAYRKEFSPVEFISEKYDRQLVEYYVNPLKYKCDLCERRAFIKCAKCGKSDCARHSETEYVRRCNDGVSRKSVRE